MHRIKNLIKKLLKNIRLFFSKKIPVYCPVMEGEYLTNRVALITGGNSGIGYSIAESFIKNGASVFITGRDTKKLEDAVKNLNPLCKSNQFIKGYILDITDISNIRKTLDKIIEENECKIDILVNNAGVCIIGDVIGTSKVDDFEKVMKTNLEGTYFMTQEIINYMRKNHIKGNILNIASSSSLRPATSAYTLTKWSIAGLTKGVAKKVISDGIVCNAIAPGPTATPMLVDNLEDISLKKLPAGRYILPEEIANLSTILVSELGRMVVGDVLYVTGGAGTVTFDD